MYPPSHDISGAVAQVLVQRDTFKESFIFVGKELSRSGHSAHALTCLVIAGTTPELQDEKEAFERYRHSLHGVIVVTFDKLLERLKSLYSLLTAKPEALVAPGGPFCPPTELEPDVEIDMF
ncbi:Shedu anti-phage system protein SduA domain-containing protein [uncultured Stenotrophomonas sp.]|uniref:Shedu anti-phage system protein SduA domain-containing protein n=1 Tax=uncultured Stenotrophomonas sp. TaxID=165438 RepID=UPI0025D497A9|nr:Shedu anti-phage system protein SduA domain-containing protein [uncultured Stenotrophomonas sp.]